jgi:hypothetical protein
MKIFLNLHARHDWKKQRQKKHSLHTVAGCQLIGIGARRPHAEQDYCLQK